MNQEPRSTDLKFFTNDEGEELLGRFKDTLSDTKYLDVIVGFFRTSGFHLLSDSFENIDKIRILVGMGIDRRGFELIEHTREQQSLYPDSHQEIRDKFSRYLVEEMNKSPDAPEVESGIKKFIELLQTDCPEKDKDEERGGNGKKLEIRAYPGKQLHAKVYISRYEEDDRDFGNVVTGSSNFTASGLEGNNEFNVQLKEAGEVRFALDRFEELWEDSIDVSEKYVQTIQKDTWLRSDITPYELYLKFLYEYFQEDINIDERLEGFLPDHFVELEYQQQAVMSAKKILDEHGGVFLADVVGLGKTFISALLAQQYYGRKLVLCPPVLEEYWKETFRQFRVTNFEVTSHGKLHHVLDDGHDYEMIFVDEAHRFRNELTQGYEMLHEICWTQAEKVVLVTATPLNNTIEDIYSQLKLFKIPRKSNIPGIPDLKEFFDPMITRLNRHNRTDPEYAEILEEVSEEVRERVLKHVMVRRTRTEVEKYYEEDLERRGVSFPEVKDPHRIIYEFDEETYDKFRETLSLLQQFKYARYTPLLYLEQSLTPLQEQSQKNVGGFMRVLLVKRLESSFFAFKNTIDRFIESYQRFVDMVDEGTVYIGDDVDIYKLLDEDNEEKIHEHLEEGDLKKYDSNNFRDQFREDLSHDLNLLHEIAEIWEEVENNPKLAAFEEKLSSHPVLEDNKILIFSESRETGEFLYQNLREDYGDDVIQYSSDGGHYEGERISKARARKIIEKNFDPNHPTQEDDVRIMISTDVLSEGINLHRSGTVVNYDLPWNPTKVLQRVGRVNRIGSENEEIHVFNIFPTAESDRHLGLEQNITAKIQAFHDILGEDARYLTEEEEISSHQLFGETLLRKLEDRETYEGEQEEGPSELKYLDKIREVRDESPDLFQKIKELPKKARTARDMPVVDKSRVLTFFRRGKLKKFYVSNGDETLEKSFLEAARLLECTADSEKRELPESYFTLLNDNKATFQKDQEGEQKKSRKGGLSNEKFVIQVLKSNDVQRCPKFTDRDHRYINEVLDAFENGMIPQQTSKFLKQKFENMDEPLDVLHTLRKKIPDRILEVQKQDILHQDKPKEVILSEFIHGSE